MVLSYAGLIFLNIKIQDCFCALGSLPPNSHSIFDEGAVFMSFKLVDNGIFQEGGKILLSIY